MNSNKQCHKIPEVTPKQTMLGGDFFYVRL